MSRRNGTTTRAIDKAIQDYFNSPTTRKDFKDGEPVEVRICRVAEIKDVSLQASLDTAKAALARLEAEHGIKPLVKEGTSLVLLIEDYVEGTEDAGEDESIDIFGDVDELIVSSPADEVPFPDDLEKPEGDISEK